MNVSLMLAIQLWCHGMQRSADVREGPEPSLWNRWPGLPRCKHPGRLLLFGPRAQGTDRRAAKSLAGINTVGQVLGHLDSDLEPAK